MISGALPASFEGYGGSDMIVMGGGHIEAGMLLWHGRWHKTLFEIRNGSQCSGDGLGLGHDQHGAGRLFLHAWMFSVLLWLCVAGRWWLLGVLAQDRLGWPEQWGEAGGTEPFFNKPRTIAPHYNSPPEEDACKPLTQIFRFDNLLSVERSTAPQTNPTPAHYCS